MSQEKIRVGIIGVGWFGLGAHWNQLKGDQRVELTAICRRNQNLLVKAAELTGVHHTYTDWREMLDSERLDAVIVCTPNNLHAEPTIAALQEGLSVLVEKPMATTTSDANAMIAAARESKGQLMVGYNRRCDPRWREVHRLIREGAIGTPRQINTVAFANLLAIYDMSKAPEDLKNVVESSGNMRPFVEDAVGKDHTWRGDPSASGGGWFVEFHTHSIDLMLWLAGSPAREVSCLLTEDNLPAERAITTQARLENNMLFSLSFTDGVNADEQRSFGKNEYTLSGDSGVIIGTEGPLGPEGGAVEMISGGERRTIVTDEKANGTTGMFIDMITRGGENPSPPEEAFWTVALTEASYRSARERRIVDVKQQV